MRLSVFLLPFFFLLSSRLFRSFFIFLLKCTGRQKKGEKKRERKASDSPVTKRTANHGKEHKENNNSNKETELLPLRSEQFDFTLLFLVFIHAHALFSKKKKEKQREGKKTLLPCVFEGERKMQRRPLSSSVRELLPVSFFTLSSAPNEKARPRRDFAAQSSPTAHLGNRAAKVALSEEPEET